MYGNLVQVCVCSWYTKMDIPASDSFANPLRKGFLQKLTGRGWLYSGTWKKRYCVLDGSKFYFYEKEKSKGSEKTCGVLNLDYFDVCEENNNAKDKKNPFVFVFVIGTSVKGFFDNRHQFSADNADDLQSWIRSIQGAITDARDNRRKPPGRKQRHLEGKSPDLSHSSQESEETSSPACLVNATKDRVRGPQGRRLPNRKSMMPTSRKEVLEEDIRQRSISLSSHQRSDTTPPKSPSVDGGKWLSLSMEEVDREKGEVEDEGGMERSSSVFDLPQKEGAKGPAHRKGVPGFLMGQHAALTKELEMRLKAGMAPGARRPPSETEVEETKEVAMVVDDRRMEALSLRVEEARHALASLEAKMDQLSKKVEVNNEKNVSQVGDVLLQVTVTLKEAERINDECKRALADANRAKAEYQLLAKECRETLDKLNSDHPESQQHGA